MGELGLGDNIDRLPPLGDALPYVDIGTNRLAVAIQSGMRFTCVLLDDGGLKCWGSNHFGQLGQGDEDVRGDEPGEIGDDLPTIDFGDGRSVRAFSLHDVTPCAQLDDGSMKCRGHQTGAGATPDSIGDNLAPVATAADLGG